MAVVHKVIKRFRKIEYILNQNTWQSREATVTAWRDGRPLYEVAVLDNRTFNIEWRVIKSGVPAQVREIIEFFAKEASPEAAQERET